MITEWQPGKKTRPELHEMLDTISNKTARKDKIQLVQEFSQYACFTDYIRCVFDSRIIFALPQGRPPFEASEEDRSPSSWHRQNKQLAYFVKGLKGDAMNPIKRENLFISLLESVDPRDAEHLIGMVSKKSSAKGLTEKLVREALPTLLS